MNKDKLIQIYEIMADMTLDILTECRQEELGLDKDDIEMIRTTQSLYETISYANQPVITTATKSMLDISDN